MWDTNTNNKLQIGANIAILLGLVMVAFQINQANDISSAEFLDAGITADNERQLALLGENPDQAMYRILLKPEEAQATDYFIADRIYETLLAQIHRSIILSQADLYLGTVRGSVRANYELFSCPYGIAYLNQEISRLTTTIDSPNPNPNTGGGGNGNRNNELNIEFLNALRGIRGLASNATAVDQMESRLEETLEIIKTGIKPIRPPRNDSPPR